jgi:hypothetical protein
MKCSINIKPLSNAQIVHTVVIFMSLFVLIYACKCRHIVLRLFFVGHFPILKRIQLHYMQFILSWLFVWSKKLRSLSPLADYTDQATAVCRRN